MRRRVRLLMVGALLAMAGSLVRTPDGWTPPVLHAAQSTAEQQNEFVPIDELPPEEQLPAAPLLVAAYSIIWIVLMWYLWSIWRRLGRVERDLAEAARRQQGQGASAREPGR